MKKIAIVRFATSYGGIEHQIINMVSVMKEKYSFILIASKESDFTDEFKKYGKLYIVDTTKLFGATKNIIEIVKKESVDILQSHMLREYYICCLCKIFIKKIYHIFRVHTYIDCSFISPFRKKMYHVLSWLLSKNVDIFLPINEVNYKELTLRTHIKSKKILIIHDGVRDVSEATNHNNYNFYDLVMIANLVYGKGHDIAIMALSELVKSNKKYNITFIGATNVDGSFDSEYNIEFFKKRAKELNIYNNIKFVGYKKNIANEIRDKSIIILPSYSEGTPNCLLEAMSAKKIVVASAVGGIPEFIENGKNGFLHENKNYKELCDIILNISHISTSKIDRICEKGYLTWKKEYKIENICKEFDKVYKEVKCNESNKT